jgi:hypothetical protein
MTNRQYPYQAPSAVTASYAISASVAVSASFVSFASSSTSASAVLNPVSGASAAVDICVITYQQYLSMLANPSLVEVCNFPP